MASRTQLRGQNKESDALNFLIKHGLTLIDRNQHCRYGELDLIMLDQACLAFIEVRLRTHRSYANGLESVNRKKQNKLIKAAQYYLQQHPQWQEYDCRFDVIAYTHINDQTPAWVQHAFMLESSDY